MVIDLVCLGFCLLYMLFGWLSGGLIQVLKIAALVGAYFASVWLEPILAEALGEHVALDEAARSWAALLGAWVVIYISLSLFINMVVKTLYKASGTLTKADRLLGAMVGLTKAGVVILLLVLLFSLVKDRIYRHRPQLVQVFESSLVMSVLGNSRVAEYLLPQDYLNLAQLAEDAADPEGRERLIQDPNIRKIQENRAFQELSSDLEFRRAVEDGRLADVFSDPRVRQILADPEMRELLLKFNRQRGGPTDADKEAEPTPE